MYNSILCGISQRRWSMIFIIGYTFIMHILYLRYYQYTFEFSYEGLLFVYNFNEAKYIWALLESIVIIWITLNNLKNIYLTETIMVMLNLLYFLPGVAQQAVTNEPWSYMFYFFLFWLMMEWWMKRIKPKQGSPFSKYFRMRNIDSYLKMLTIISLIVTAMLMLYHHKSFSIASFQETLLDVYEVRAEATNAGTHWIIVNIKLWAAYLIVLLTAYYSYHRKWVLSAILVIAEFSLFLIEANRIFVFLELGALVVGIFRIDSNKTPIAMMLISVLLLIEVNVIDVGLLFNDVFRRYTIVPNRISGFYFDYFSTHTPDFLRSMYDRTSTLLGFHSIYVEKPISRMIGEVYLGWAAGCNTGLVGGCMFCFGYLAAIISTFGYIMAFRLHEGTIATFQNPSVKYALAITLVSLSINTYGLLANLINTNYFLMLYLTLAPFANKKIQNDM